MATSARHAQAVFASAWVGGLPAKAEKKDRSQGGDADRAGELLHRVEHTGGGTELVHPDAGEDDVKQLPHRHSGAGAEHRQSVVLLLSTSVIICE